MKNLLLLDAVKYVNDRRLDGVDLLKVPTMHSYGVNNAHANRREIRQIMEIWEAEGFGTISTVEHAPFFFTFNDRAKAAAESFEKQQNRRSISDRLADDKFQKISTLTISFFSLAVSVAAIVVAYLAYVKAN